MSKHGVLSTADERRPIIVEAAVTRFADGGFYGTTVANVATEAGISPAYVFKLFPSKEQLFSAALDRCFERICETLARAADEVAGSSPEVILDRMVVEYDTLIVDRTLLMLQVHAQSAAGIAEIGQALRRGLEAVVDVAARHSDGTDKQVQHFMAYGQLCHLIVTAGITGSDAPWARMLSAGVHHAEPEGGDRS